ncbi:MAG: ABC transporter substrate-binding protein [Pseudomonadota bacterium]|nr:ABC transporter substrate-binding protein [Pseudomonadota bacterium]
MTSRASGRRIAAATITLAVSILALAPAAASAEPKRGGTLTIGTEAEFNGFNHRKARIFNQNTSTPASAVMETLFAYEGQNIVPRLGLEFTEAPDRLSAVVTLRQGVKFHDGTPFNADAVVHHYNWVLAPDSGINSSMMSSIEKVEKVDDHSVRFVLKSPWTALRSVLALEHLLNFIGSPTAIQNDPEGFHRKPVGTGPFVFKEWRAGDSVTMERNPQYWDSSLPYLDRVIYRVLPDGNTRYQSIKSGEVDIGRMDVATHVVDAKKQSGLVVHEYEGSGGFMWNFNHSKPPFDDARARAAVVHAFNAPAMVETYFLGTTTVSTDLLGARSSWHCPNLNWRGYDLEKAKSLIKEIGKPVEFQLTTTNTPAGRRQGTMIQQFMEQAGMKMEIRLVEQSQNVRVGLSGDYEMDVWRFSDIGGDPDLVLSYYFSNKAGKAVMRHDATKIDALLDQARVETDEKKRHQMYCDVAQIFSDEAIALIPIRTTYFAIAQPYVKDVPQLQNSLIRPRSMWLDK